MQFEFYGVAAYGSASRNFNSICKIEIDPSAKVCTVIDVTTPGYADKTVWLHDFGIRNCKLIDKA